jgi:hypothetical protein
MKMISHVPVKKLFYPDGQSIVSVESQCGVCFQVSIFQWLFKPLQVPSLLFSSVISENIIYVTIPCYRALDVKLEDSPGKKIPLLNER